MEVPSISQLFVVFEKTFNFYRSAQFIHYASLALDNSLVYMKACLQRQTSILVHLSQNGETLWQVLMPHTTPNLSMINSKDIIVLNQQNSSIDIYSLDTRSIVSISHKFSKLNLIVNFFNSVQIIHFSDSKLFCLVQSENEEKKITYFCLQNINEKSKPVISFKIQQDSKNGLLKLNNHSKIGWLSCSLGKVNYFISFELSDKFEVIKKEIIPKLKEKNQADSLKNAYQFEKNRFLVVFQPNNTIFVISKLATINILPNGDCVLKELHLCSKDQINFSNLKYFNGIFLERFLVLQENNSNFYNFLFVDYQSGQVQAIEKSIRYTKMLRCDWDHAILIQIIKSDLLNIKYSPPKVKIRKLIPKKEEYLHFLLQINEDWDDDLLGDAIDMLT